MVFKKISTGAAVMDALLEGGYETDVVTTVFGPAGSGKTNIALIGAIQTAKQGKKVIYIDTEGGFSVERLNQLCASNKKIMENIMFLKPTKFSEQKKSFEKLKDYINSKDVGLIIVDTLAMLYRLEMGKNEDIYSTNKELGMQISYLTEIVRKKNIPVLITNQVYSVFDARNKVNMVGGDIIKYGSKCLIELQMMPSGKRKALLKKHIPRQNPQACA